MIYENLTFSLFCVCLSVRAISRGGGRRAWGKERRLKVRNNKYKYSYTKLHTNTGKQQKKLFEVEDYDTIEFLE